jgi:hypothetical protein
LFLTSEVDLRKEIMVVLLEDGGYRMVPQRMHRARAVTARLNELFGNRIVSLGQEHEWPPRSPDLTPLDFFLWGYIKGQVYKTPPANVDELRERITNEFAALRRTRMARRAMRDMRTRAIKCVELEGGHVEGRN